MSNDKEFQSKVQRIGELVGGLENIENPEARASAKALVQLLLDLHATGLDRMLEIVAKQGGAGQQAIDELGSDALVSSLLVLYGLHPLDFESRVLVAVEKVTPRVRKGGGELQLLGIENGNVRLHLDVPAGHSCGSTGKTLRAMLEDAVYEAAPDVNGLLIEGLEEAPGSSGFVPLGKLGAAMDKSPDRLTASRS